MEIFDNSAKYYAKYRDQYSAKLFDFLETIAPSNRNLLDLGCGTGQIPLQMSNKFDHLLGVDISKDMIDYAEKRAELNSIENIDWRVSATEDLDLDPSSVDIITIAKALHWMDIDLVMQKSLKWLRPNGVIAIISGTSLWNSTQDWEQEIKKLIQKYLGKERKVANRNQSFKRDERDFRDILRAKFGNVAEKSITYNRKLRFKDILGYLYSTSFSRRSLFGEKVSDFEKELKEVFTKVSDGDLITKEEEISVIYAVKEISAVAELD